MPRQRLTNSLKKTARTFVNLLPIIVGMLLLTSLVVTALPDQMSAALFAGNEALDAVIGAAAGRVAAGHPLVSYPLVFSMLSGALMAKIEGRQTKR